MKGVSKACGCPLLPLKNQTTGHAPRLSDQGEDIVDEAIKLFRANVFFKHFDLKTPSDRILVYLTFYINMALKRLEGCRTLTEGTKAIKNLSMENVYVPGEPGFSFSKIFPPFGSNKEAEVIRDYFKHIREETNKRLLNVAYRANGTPNKWWLAFAKRFIAMFATPANQDVDCCLIPESPFYLEGQGGLFEFIQHRLKENGHVVIVVAEGAGQEYVSNAVNAIEEKDASGNKLLLDIGQWLTQKIKDHFEKVKKVPINMKYIGT
ncbi:hypothetical protein LXL04_028088 [Taraxacum kok-saghyz]